MLGWFSKISEHIVLLIGIGNEC